MQVKQIATIVNDIFGEVLGDSLVQEDLSNIVSAGQLITSSTEFGDNLDNYARKIIDKVGRTIIVDRNYTALDLGIWRDSFEYGCILEKIRVEVGEVQNNPKWTLTNDNGSGVEDWNDNLGQNVLDLFKFYPASVRARYFNMKTTLQIPISIVRDQLRGAFRSASELAKFIGAIENRIRTKLEILKDQLQRRTLANLMAHKIANGTNCVDLKTEFTAIGGTAPATLAEALHDRAFVRFMAERITMDRKLMSAPSNIYSDLSGTFYNFTPASDARLIVLDDIDSALRFNLYGDTFNKEFVTLEGYKTIPFWQGTGATMALDDRSKLYVETTEEEEVEQGSVVGVLMDRTAAMICNEEPEVIANDTKTGKFINYFYNLDCSYYNDYDENAIVYVYGLVEDEDDGGGE